MSREHRSLPLNAFVLAACVALGAPARAVDAPHAEFTAKAADYDASFGEASAAIKQIILDEKFEVVGVADFTDLAGQPLQIGRLYAEEFATRLVGPRKKYRMLDPGTLLGLVEASGGPSLWATPEKIRQFGAKSKVELVVTGRIEIAPKEARFFIKAIATDDAGVVWARTIAVPGVSAAAAEAAAEAEALAAQTKLVATPFAGDTAATDSISSSINAADPAAAAAVGAAAVAVPAASSAVPTTTNPVPTTAPAQAAPSTSSAPASSGAASGAIVAAAGVAALASSAAGSGAPAPSNPSPASTSAASSPATSNPPATTAAKPAAVAAPAATSAPISSGAAVATAAVATGAAAASTAPSVLPPAAKPAAAAAVTLPAEILTFENAWLRARVRSASKYEGSGWVTAVLDLTNLSDRPIKLDAAQDDPGKGVDELGNNWRIERVSGLKLASGAGTVNTMLNPASTVSVVVVLATSAQPSGRRLSFGPNLYWFGSPASGDSGRVAVAFSNIRVN